MMDIGKVCRTCLCDTDVPMKSIYAKMAINRNDRTVLNWKNGIVGDGDDDSDETEDIAELTIHSMIAACASSTADDAEGLPTQICEHCSENLLAFYSFKIRCERAFERLTVLLAASRGSLEDQSEGVDDVTQMTPTPADCDQHVNARETENNHRQAAHFDEVSEALPVNTCQFCSVEFSRKAKLKKHIETKHPEKLQATKNGTDLGSTECNRSLCAICDQFFDKENDYLQHRNCDKGTIIKSKLQEAVNGVDNTEISIENVDRLQFEQNFNKLNDSFLGTPRSEASDMSYHEEYLDQSIDQKIEANVEDEPEETVDQLTEDIISQASIKEAPRRSQKQRSNQRAATKRSIVANNSSKGAKCAPAGQSVATDQFKCDECTKIFKRVTHLKRHKLTHTDERPFCCDICDKRFRRADHLRIHKHHHSAVKPHVCDHCEKGFTRIEHVRRHIMARHSDRPPLKKEFMCDICKRGFTTSKYLQTHIKSHSERSYDCKFCGLKFAKKPELTEHIKSHANERPYLCSECGLRFVRNDYLVIHMRRHKGEKPYKCKYCNKGFPRATDLTVHERYHTGEKSHLCTTCGKGFQRAYNLLVHMRVHSGEKPYQCPHCVKCFAQGNDLKSHVRRHTGERYKCELCGAGFIQGYHLTQHKRNVHGIALESHIRRVTKFLPSTMQQANASAIADSVDNKQQVFQVLSADGHHLYTSAHDAIDMQHQILVPMSIDNGGQLAMHSQKAIVMLQVENPDIKLEPHLSQVGPEAGPSNIYQTTPQEQQFNHVQP